MACNYYFDGNFIGDELQLADFLLSKHKYLKQFGDIVFQLNSRALSNNSKLQGEIFKAGQDADIRLKKYVAKHGIEYDEDGRAINLETPAMGVNKFLGKYVHPDGPLKGKQIIPEFRKEEYWSRKTDPKEGDWFKLDFSDEEKELICEIEGNPDFFADMTKVEVTEASAKLWKDKIQEKWDAQGKIGTSLHAVSELFFGKRARKPGETEDHYNFEDIVSGGIAVIKDFYDNHFKNERDEYNKMTFGDYVEFEQFKHMIEMCSKLKTQLEAQYGSNLTFYPEFTISANLAKPFKYNNKGKEEECDEIIGIIDLLVVDEKGRTHIYDYKTSPKDYGKYSTAKKRGFTYQLAVYDRILQHYGIYTGDGSVSIIPIKLDDFKYDNPNGKYTFKDIQYEIIEGGQSKVQVEELNIKGNDSIESTLDEFLPSNVKIELHADNLLEKVADSIKKLCPTYQQQRNMDDAQIREMIEKGNGFKLDKNGELHFKFAYGFGKEIVVEADEPHKEAEMFKRVKEEITSWPQKKQRTVEAFKEDFETAVREGSRFEYRNAEMGYGKQNSEYLSDLISPYCDGKYEIIDMPQAMYLGMLLLRNKEDGTVTVLKLTGAQLDFQHEFVPGRTNMNGYFEPDITEDSKGNKSLMLKSINANIEALEAMLALQYMEADQDHLNIKEIKIINPREQKGLPVSNKELLYTYKTLLKHENVLGNEENKFDGDSPKIRMLTDAERLKAEFMHIVGDATFGNKKFNESVRPEIQSLNALDWNSDIKKEDLYQKLDTLRIKLEESYSQLKVVSRDLADLVKPENQLYNAIMSTMMELKGINVRQQIKDADNWLENKKVWKYGWEGLKLENAGNFKSDILNQLTKSVSNVYQKVKDKVNKENITVRKLVEALKREKNFGWVKSNISGNQTDMYKNMTYVASDGDFLFVRPDSLPQGAERDFLEHALDVINKNRWPSETQETRDSWKRNGDLRYYRVPLMAASTGSRMSTNDMLTAGKDRLKRLSPKNALKELEEKAMGLFEDSKSQDDQEKIYEMNNIFDAGESSARERMLSKKEGADLFEHNIETILLAHTYSYELRNQMSKEMPLIKASALALSMQGAGANLEDGNFDHLLDFIQDYTKGVIKNQSIVKKDLRPLQAITGKVRKAASFLALAFSPIQFTYQSLEGIWKDCSLIIRKPDGTNAFTTKNMWESAKAVYSDLKHYSDKPTKCQLINETYGINDMDANQFTSRISSDHSIWTHFTDFAFRLASRPDYYNRMTIFGAQMRADGVWDAHEVEDGALVYKFNKDQRYAALKTAPKNSEEYKEALSRYIAALEQFKAEGVTNPDGSELKFGDDLPRAYTNQEAQAMKAIADSMYGYYNHENKSMMNAMFLGGLVTQMKTYWSAKKNQYLAPGGVKLQGKWVDYKENGKQLYYQVDERGEIDLSKPLVKEGEPGNSGIKVQKWEGQWQEGIILTLSKFVDSWITHKSFKAAWHDIVDVEDVNLRTAYRSNLKHILLDIFFAVVVGNLFAALMDPWKEEAKKKSNKDQDDMGLAAQYAAVSLVADSFEHSFMDFNFLESIFSPTMDWQPFAFSSLQRLAENVSDYITTDQSFASTIANSASVLRQAKPIIKCIGYNEE